MKKSAICSACGKPCIKFLTNYILVDSKDDPIKLPQIKCWYHSHKEKKTNECKKAIINKAFELHGCYYTVTGIKITGIKEGVCNDDGTDIPDKSD